MRIRITFNVNNRGGMVPFHHQFLISKVFKSILEEINLEGVTHYPFYSFSGLKGQTRLGRKGLHYNSRKVTIVISSASPEFMSTLVSAILSKEYLLIGELNLSPEVAEEEKSLDLSWETKYICISPLVINDQSDGDKIPFISPESNEFSDLLYESTLERMVAFGIDTDSIPEVQKFQVVPDKEYLERLKRLNKKFSRVYPMYSGDQKVEVRGYTFPFTLYASQEMHDFLFTCGFGLYCANGFGMLDLAHTDPTDRVVPYNPEDALVSVRK